jgi:hypothetical protein
LSLYLDTSVLVSLFLRDDLTDSVLRWFEAIEEELAASDWSAAEFTSALGIRRRRGELDPSERDAAEAALDGWLGRVERLEVSGADFVLARQLIRTELTSLRAADALHVAIALRWGATLVTTDRQMSQAAEVFGLPVQDLSPHP